MSIINAVDWFIPDKLKVNIVIKGRARITVFVMFVIAIILLPNAIRGFTIGKPELAVAAMLSSILMVSCAFLMKYTKSQLIAGNCFLFIFALLLTIVTIIRGGVVANYAMNFTMVVIISFIMTSLKNGALWSFICLSILASMKIAADSGIKFAEPSTDTAFVNVTVVTFVIAVIAGVYEWNSTRNLKLFAKEKDQSERAAEELRKILTETNDIMSGVSNGDLSRGIQADVEGDLSRLKSSVNNALQLLGDSLSQVMLSSNEINRGSTEISSAAQDLASGSTEQAASVEQISSAMNEIGSRAKTNDQNASMAQTLSNQAVSDLNTGNAQMDAMLEAMNTISETSTNVSKVIKVIDEIAFQTNLLALNAAVEAARAGKYGKGFAVVADEVRNLAARSSEAAKDTTELIETSIRNVENGVDSANVTADTLKGFVETINKVNNIVGEISSASKEQTDSVAEINHALQQVNDVVQRNSSISEESASASEELSSQTDVLQNLMNKFKLAATPPTPTPTAVQAKKPVKSKVSAPLIPPVTHPVTEKGRKKIVLDDDDFGKY